MSARPSGTLNVKVIEEHLAHTQALPDERLRVTLSDGRTFIIDAERLHRQDDGTYLIAINAADRLPTGGVKTP